MTTTRLFIKCGTWAKKDIDKTRIAVALIGGSQNNIGNARTNIVMQ